MVTQGRWSFSCSDGVYLNAIRYHSQRPDTDVMAHLKFKHVFMGLMGASAITAFAVPSRFVTARVPSVEILFAPVARPSGALARVGASPICGPELSSDQRAAEVVKRENEALKDEIASLTVRFAELQRINEDAQTRSASANSAPPAR